MMQRESLKKKAKKRIEDPAFELNWCQMQLPKPPKNKVIEQVYVQDENHSPPKLHQPRFLATIFFLQKRTETDHSMTSNHRIRNQKPQQ